MTEYLGKVKKKTIKTKCGAMLCFFFRMEQFLEDFSGVTRKCKILEVIKFVKTLTEIQSFDR